MNFLMWKFYSFQFENNYEETNLKNTTKFEVANGMMGRFKKI